jgi:hypothetical protein
MWAPKGTDSTDSEQWFESFDRFARWQTEQLLKRVRDGAAVQKCRLYRVVVACLLGGRVACLFGGGMACLLGGSEEGGMECLLGTLAMFRRMSSHACSGWVFGCAEKGCLCRTTRPEESWPVPALHSGGTVTDSAVGGGSAAGQSRRRAMAHGPGPPGAAGEFSLARAPPQLSNHASNTTLMLTVVYSDS